MKFLKIIFLFFVCCASAQQQILLDTINIQAAKDLLADDYGNFYLYSDGNFSLTRYDSLGIRKGRLMLTVPFKLQSVQNPLNIPLFSENAQEFRFVDQNLNEIQTIKLQEFGFVVMAYAEDHDRMWLLDESAKRLIQYSYQDRKIISQFPLNAEYQNVRDLMVFNNKIYLLSANVFRVFEMSGKKIFEAETDDANRLRRENSRIYIIGKNYVKEFQNGTALHTVFYKKDASIVDKNSRAYLAVAGNKLYLYGLLEQAPNPQRVNESQ